MTYQTMLFRKKPIQVEVMQFTGINYHELFIWSNQKSYVLSPHSDSMSVIELSSPEGFIRLWTGDYLVKGVKGIFYPVKKEIFEKSYEGVRTASNLEYLSQRGEIEFFNSIRIEVSEFLHTRKDCQPWRPNDPANLDTLNLLANLDVVINKLKSCYSSQNGKEQAQKSLDEINASKDEDGPIVSQDNTCGYEKNKPFPLWHKQLEIGDKFLGRCTQTGQEVEFAVLGYDRMEAKLNLAILSSSYPKSWPIVPESKSHTYAWMTVHLWDKGLEILEYR